MFRKYFSIEGSWRNKEIQWWLEKYPQLANETYVLQEKIHGCLDYDVLLNTKEHGDLKIGDIVEKNIKCHVLSHDVENNKTSYQPIINVSKQDNKNDWLEIELENGKKITITENHYIWIPKERVWRRAKDLNGDEELQLS